MARPGDHTHEPTVALVFSPEMWVERLHRHLTDHGGARVRQVVLEPALALEDEYDTLVVSHRWPGLTRGLVAAVHERARSVLGVFDRDEPAGRAHLTGLGVDSVIGSDATTAEFVDAIHALTPPRSPAVPERRVVHDAASSAGMIVVAGAPGAGASEVALGLTAALAARGERVALVDADEVASSSAARLGLAIEPNLRDAIDAVQHGTPHLSATLFTLGRPPFDVVPGCVHPAAAAQIRADDVARVTRAVGEGRSHVVAEVTGVPGARIAPVLVPEASVLVGVGVATPIGVTKLLAWLARLPEGAPPAHVVLNRAPTGRYERGELGAEIWRAASPASVTFVPYDRGVARATWTGTLLARGPFNASIAELVRIAVPRTAAPGGSVRRARRPRSAA